MYNSGDIKFKNFSNVSPRIPSNIVPQQEVEDILTTLLRNKKTASADIIRKYAGQVKILDKTLKRMIQDTLITQQNY